VRRSIEFASDDVTLRGFFYPATRGEPPHPVLVMSHGWGATLRMGLEPYAERFASVGVSVLLHDNPNIGSSDGEPRFEINPWVRARATRDAVAFAAGLDGVDPSRIAIWGDSGDAARVFVNAAIDDRVSALVSFNPTFGSAPPTEEPDPDTLEGMRRVMDDDRLPTEMEVTYGPALVVSDDPDTESMSPSPTAFRWFFEYGGRHGSGWENRWSYARNATGVEFSPYDCLPSVTIPVLMMIGRDDEIESCDRDASRRAFEQLGGHAEWYEVDGGHFGALHIGSPEYEEAVTAQADFLVTALDVDD
jgi:pimeloyl-ACP methyl ester carboxylesterase